MEPCPNCGQPIRGTARFCTSCGYRIPERAQGSTSSSTSSFASTWIEESAGSAAAAEPEVAASTWPAAPAAEIVEEKVEFVETVPAVVYAAPVVAVDPIDEIVAATAGYNDDQESLVDMSQNKVNIALYHIETLRQLMPELSAWSVERAQSVNAAIAAMETAIKGREGDDDTFYGLRLTVAAARKDPRDIDVMIALSDRALDIEDLLKAHDAYSIGIRKALIDLKPLAVEYVKVPKRRAAPARKSSTTRSRSTASKTSASKTSTTAAKRPTTAKSTSTTAKSASTRAKSGSSSRASSN